MNAYRYWRRRVIDRVPDQFPHGNSLVQLDHELRRVRCLSEDEQAALWLLAWGEQQRQGSRSDPSGRKPARDGSATHTQGPSSTRDDQVVEALKVARIETETEVAVLGEIRDGREIVRDLAGDGGSFGLFAGASMPIEDTYCQRLLTGKLSNVVPDAQANEHVKDLEITRAAPIGAYIGVPLTGLDARLYVLCCLAHEQRPQLGEQDVLFLRGLGEEIVAALDDRRTRQRERPA